MSVDFGKASVLVTGGSEGIGLALAARWLARGSRVLVTGRSAEKLARAKAAHPALDTLVNDVSRPEERERLAAHVREAMPEIDVLVNNAGIQRRVALAEDAAPWAERQLEIDTLLAAPIHLCALLVPRLLADAKPSLIVNVTSGGAYVPQPFAPVYSACKAALRSYTVNLRFALVATQCKVVELAPPAVRTSLSGPSSSHGAPLDDFADAVFASLETSEPPEEIGFGPTASPPFVDARNAARALFASVSTRFSVKTYASKP